MATLYRKYRPLSFGEVVGQNNIKLTLEYELKSGMLAHAYLFCGPRAVGKTTLARVMAKSLNCQRRQPGQSEPCNECPACVEIAEGRAMDVIEIDAASNTGVENVRENIIASTRVASVSMKYKVFIIDEVHMLSSSAFNALLKTLEEPPANVVFILCTTEVHKLPSTIISRCQRFDFKRISVMDVVRKLEYILSCEGIKADKSVLEAIARYSGGHMRDAESALGQILSLVDKPAEGQMVTLTSEHADLVIPKNDLEQSLKLVEFLILRDASNAIRLVNLMVDDGFDLKVYLNDTVELLRQMMLMKVNPELIPGIALEVGESLSAKMISLLGSINLTWLLKSINSLTAARTSLKEAVLAQLPLEMAIVEICELEAAAAKPKPEFHDSPKAPVPVPAVAPATVTKSVPSDQLIDINNIIVRWSEFMANIKKNNHSLSFTMMTAKPKTVENNTLYLTFKHKLHKDRLGEIEVQRIVEKALEEVYNAKLSVAALLEEAVEAVSEAVSEPTLTPAPAITQPISDPAIEEVLKTLGGKIVG